MAAVTSSGASTGCKAVDRMAGRLRQDWRVVADEPKQKGLDDGKPGCISRRDGDRRAVKHDLEGGQARPQRGLRARDAARDGGWREIPHCWILVRTAPPT